MSEITHLTDIDVLAFPGLSSGYDGLSTFKERQARFEEEWNKETENVARNSGGALLYFSHIPTDLAVATLFPDEVWQEEHRIQLYSDVLGIQLVRLDEKDVVEFSTKLPAILRARHFDWDQGTRIFAFGKFYETWVNRFLHRIGDALNIPEANRIRVKELSLKDPDA